MIDLATVMGCVSLFFGIVTEDAGWSHEKCLSDLHCAPSALRYCCCKTDLEVSLITWTSMLGGALMPGSQSSCFYISKNDYDFENHHSSDWCRESGFALMCQFWWID